MENNIVLHYALHSLPHRVYSHVSSIYNQIKDSDINISDRTHREIIIYSQHSKSYIDNSLPKFPFEIMRMIFGFAFYSKSMIENLIKILCLEFDGLQPIDENMFNLLKLASKYNIPIVFKVNTSTYVCYLKISTDATFNPRMNYVNIDSCSMFFRDIKDYCRHALFHVDSVIVEIYDENNIITDKIWLDCVTRTIHNNDGPAHIAYMKSLPGQEQFKAWLNYGNLRCMMDMMINTTFNYYHIPDTEYCYYTMEMVHRDWYIL